MGKSLAMLWAFTVAGLALSASAARSPQSSAKAAMLGIRLTLEGRDYSDCPNDAAHANELRDFVGHALLRLLDLRGVRAKVKAAALACLSDEGKGEAAYGRRRVRMTFLASIVAKGREGIKPSLHALKAAQAYSSGLCALGEEVGCKQQGVAAFEFVELSSLPAEVKLTTIRPARGHGHGHGHSSRHGERHGGRHAGRRSHGGYEAQQDSQGLYGSSGHEGKQPYDTYNKQVVPGKGDEAPPAYHAGGKKQQHGAKGKHGDAGSDTGSGSKAYNRYDSVSDSHDDEGYDDDGGSSGAGASGDSYGKSGKGSYSSTGNSSVEAKPTAAALAGEGSTDVKPAGHSVQQDADNTGNSVDADADAAAGGLLSLDGGNDGSDEAADSADASAEGFEEDGFIDDRYNIFDDPHARLAAASVSAALDAAAAAKTSAQAA